MAINKRQYGYEHKENQRMSIEVTVFVPFTYEAPWGILKGTAEIYGSENDYDIVKMRDEFGTQIIDQKFIREMRAELLHEQYVYDTVREAITMEYDAR